MLDLKKSDSELQAKSIHEIQHETALAWGARAVSAYSQYLRTGKLNWLLDGEEYYVESIEHASAVEQKNPTLLRDLQKEIAPYRKNAFLAAGVEET